MLLAVKTHSVLRMAVVEPQLNGKSTVELKDVYPLIFTSTLNVIWDSVSVE